MAASTCMGVALSRFEGRTWIEGLLEHGSDKNMKTYERGVKGGCRKLHSAERCRAS
jgi:hypothetical protein